MDYINYVKQSPVQGLTGLYGGVQGSLMAAVAAPSGEVGNSIDYGGGRGFFTTETVLNYFSYLTDANASDFGEATIGSDSAGLCGSGGNRAVFVGGGSETTMKYVTTTSTGNASDFGTLSPARYAPTGCSNGTRGLWGGGRVGSNTTNIAYITVASAGNASSFGELNLARHGRDSISGGVRGIFANGQDPHTTSIEYVTVSSTGNASNFGNTTTARTFGTGSNSDPGSGQNRGVFMAGFSGVDDHCDYINCSSTGNATEWGELVTGHGYRCGSGTNGPTAHISGGGNQEMTFVNIDTAGSSTAGGNLYQSGSGAGASGNA